MFKMYEGKSSELLVLQTLFYIILHLVSKKNTLCLWPMGSCDLDPSEQDLLKQCKFKVGKLIL